VPRNEAQRRTALIKTAVFEWAELECAGRHEHDGTQGPAIGHQPVRLPHDQMEPGIEQMRGDAEGTPDEQITGDQQKDEGVPVGPRRCHPFEAVQQRQCRRQHHSRGHQQPPARIEQAGQ
jgi:hypothetical protein